MIRCLVGRETSFLGNSRYLRWGLPVRRQIVSPSEMPGSFANVCQRTKGNCSTPDSLVFFFGSLGLCFTGHCQEDQPEKNLTQILAVGSVLHCSALCKEVVKNFSSSQKTHLQIMIWLQYSSGTATFLVAVLLA